MFFCLVCLSFLSKVYLHFLRNSCFFVLCLNPDGWLCYIFWLPDKTDSPLRFVNALLLQLLTSASLHSTLACGIVRPAIFPLKKCTVWTFCSYVRFSRFATPRCPALPLSCPRLCRRPSIVPSSPENSATRLPVQRSAWRHAVLACPAISCRPWPRRRPLVRFVFLGVC